MQTEKRTYRFLYFWKITIEPWEFDNEDFELTPRDSRYWSMKSTMARFQRNFGRPLGEWWPHSATPMQTPVETPSSVSKALPSRRTPQRQAVLKPASAEASGVCLHCGKKFHGMRRDAKFCKPAHRQAYWKENKKAAALAA